jgi:hypothetical protein
MCVCNLFILNRDQINYWAGWWFESTQGHHKLSIESKLMSL